MPLVLMQHGGAGVGLAPSGGGLPDSIGSRAAPRVRALALNTARLDAQQALKLLSRWANVSGLFAGIPSGMERMICFRQ